MEVAERWEAEKRKMINFSESENSDFEFGTTVLVGSATHKAALFFKI